jgi:hypothetical protein
MALSMHKMTEIAADALAEWGPGRYVGNDGDEYRVRLEWFCDDFVQFSAESVDADTIQRFLINIVVMGGDV